MKGNEGPHGQNERKRSPTRPKCKEKGYTVKKAVGGTLTEMTRKKKKKM